MNQYRIALETGMTIIPVAISGGYEIWPHNRTLPETRDKATGRKRIRTDSGGTKNEKERNGGPGPHDAAGKQDDRGHVA